MAAALSFFHAVQQMMPLADGVFIVLGIYGIL
jgi:hypothetical protein